MSSPHFQLQVISSQQAIPVRQRVLRPQQELTTVIYPMDQDPQTLHVGVFFDNTLCTVATFVQEAPQHKVLAKTFQQPYRLRGMATLHEFQSQGLGRRALEFGISELKSRGADLLWFNARQTAFQFYEKLGCQFQGELFEIPGAGPHKVMYKEI